MKKPVVIIGIGEIGGVFARGLLRSGYPLVPVNRSDDIQQIAAQYPDPEAVLLTVAETDLYQSLITLPSLWRDRLCMVQNELLPRDWQEHDIQSPTVMSVWFEKKPGMDTKPVVASPVFGPHADLLCEALQSLDIPVVKLESEQSPAIRTGKKKPLYPDDKYCRPGHRRQCCRAVAEPRTLAIEVAEDVLQLQAWLTGEKLDNKALIAAMLLAFEGDPEHGCTGRSASARLHRALQLADDANLELHTLRRIQAEQ